MRRARALALLLGLVAAGCAGTGAGPSPSANAGGAVEDLAAAYAPAAVAGCLAAAPDQQRACRDRIAQALIVAIDLRHAAFERRFFEAARSGDFAAALMSLEQGSAADGAGAPAATILAAIGIAVSTVPDIVSREVLAERAATALLTAMRSERQRVGQRLRAGLRIDAAGYPLTEALADLHRYDRAGTIAGALVAVSRALGREATEAPLAGERASPPRTVRPRPVPVARGMSQSEAAEALRQHLRARGLSDAERIGRLQAIQRAAGAEGFADISSGDVAVGSFLRDTAPESEDRMARIARRMGLAR